MGCAEKDQGKHEEESKKNCQTLIFVKVDGSKAFPLDVSLSDEVGDIVERIPNSACSKRDVYVICERRVIRRSDDLWSSGVGDGSIVHVSRRMFGGGRHTDKKSKAEKQVRQVLKNAEGLKSGKGRAIQECDRDTK